MQALFRVDFSGRGELADRQQKLALMLSRLQKLRLVTDVEGLNLRLLPSKNVPFSEEYNVAVYITNQMTADPGAGMSFVADPKKPVGGHILAHASATRIMVSLSL